MNGIEDPTGRIKATEWHKRLFETYQSFIDIITGLKTRHPEWEVKHDNRIEMFGRCKSMLGNAYLSQSSYLKYLSQPEFWKSLNSNMRTDDINSILSEYERHIRFSLVHSTFSIFESSIRVICQQLNSEEYEKKIDSFFLLYEYVFTKAEMPELINDFNFFRNIRNTIHNNGIFYNRKMKQVQITWNNKPYKFVPGEKINFLDRDTILVIITETGKKLNEFIEKEAIININYCPLNIGGK